MQRFFLLLGILLLAGACATPSGKGDVVSLPAKSEAVQLDSVDGGVLLNPMGIVAMQDYLVVASLHKDKLFDVFDLHSLKYLYSGLSYGGGPNDLSAFRWIRPWRGNEFYTVGLGIPLLTQVCVEEEQMRVTGNNFVQWEKDICQNLFPLKADNVLIQPGKKQGEWCLYNQASGEVLDMPVAPFQSEEAESGDWIRDFQNRAVNVAIHPHQERIVFFYCKFPYVRMFDFEGHVVFESCVGEAIIHPSAYLEKKENYYISCAYTDALIVAKYRPAEGDSDTSYFQVWDWEGHLLSLFEIKDRINLFTLSPDGKTLYAVKSDNDHLFWCNLPRMGQKN